MNEYLICFFLIVGHLASRLNGQQQYSGNSVLSCNNTDKKGPSPAFLYSCNGEKHFCPAFLIFRSQSTYNSATAISNLTSSSAVELARINNISISGVLPQSREVIVPVNCSCSGQYYQANASYLIQSDYDTYYTIANNTYQGLSTCDALKRENPYDALDIGPGMTLRVPLRCACPSKNQTRNGIKFLLTYLVTWNDNIADLSYRFNVTARSLADANGFSEKDPVLYPFTTILIPLSGEPFSSQPTVYSSVDAPSPSTPPRRRKESQIGIYIGIAAGSSFGILSCVLFLIFSHFVRGKINEASLKNKDGNKMQNLPANILDKIADFDQELKIYEFEELEAATGNFSPQKKLSDSVY
ncbi:lysM domain receptor-like kinase 4 [Coffea arabica]|uniref:LysM domain receptor-like kinase 4 n=2 Tax=Coffea TaxID=13442 RepID=A0A6P6TM62_COFAR|nr:lysM domain receptor-like kinase 4 [Coffea arabica]